MSARHFTQPFKKKTFTPIFILLLQNEKKTIGLTEFSISYNYIDIFYQNLSDSLSLLLCIMFKKNT